MIGAKQRPSFTQPDFELVSAFPLVDVLDGKKMVKEKQQVSQSRAGFTLIELLITAAIFSVASLLGASVFTRVQNTQRTLQNQQRLNTDGRYVIETIARSIRTGSINYAQFNNAIISNPIDSAAGVYFSTVDQLGVVTCYRRNSATVEVAVGASVDCATASWVAFTPDDLQVDALRFSVYPETDPFRAKPQANGDCKISMPEKNSSTFPTIITQGFDLNLGVCACSPASAAADCFSGLCTTTVAAHFACTGDPSVSCIDATDTSCSTAIPGTSCASLTRSICTNPIVQPHVTIFLQTSSKAAGASIQSKSSLQTTVTSRLYQ